MAWGKNVALTIAVTGILVAALLVLFPQPVGATTVDLTRSGIGAIDENDKLLLAFNIQIEAGEHFPTDYWELRVHNGAPAFDAQGRIIAPWCTLDSASGSITVKSISGATASLNNFFGYGYEVDAGTSTFTNKQQLNDLQNYNGQGHGAGFGYGYGSASATTTLTVELEIMMAAMPGGCPFFTSATPFSADFHFQALVGILPSTPLIWSLPIDKTLYNPDWAGLSTTAAAGTFFDVAKFAPTSSSGLTGSGFRLTSAGGGNERIDPSTLTEAQRTVTLVPADLGMINLKKIKTIVKAGAPDVPPGTEMTFTEGKEGTGTRTNPLFGISPAALQSTSSFDPAFWLNINLQAPGQGDLDVGTYIESVAVDFCVPVTYFTQTGTTAADFKVSGFTINGGLKTAHPGRTAGPTLDTTPDPDEQCYTYTITTFSSFAGHGAAAAGGGGGGTTPPPPAATTDTDGDGLPDTWEQTHFGSATGADPSADPDGDGLTNLQEFQQGTDPNKADTDGDGISDGDEVAAGTDPLDAGSPGSGIVTPTPTPAPTPTGPSDEDKDTKRSRTPGLEVVGLIGALGAAMLLARRR